MKGGPFGDKKILEKKSHSAEKKSHPVLYVTLKKVCTKFPLASLPEWAPWVVSGLFLKSGPISVRLKKKKGHCYSRAFFLKRKTRRLKTSRERPKSAPYLRLKNSKRTSKYSLLRYRKNPKVEPNWHTRGNTLKFFIHSVANHQKNGRRGTFGEKKNFFQKVSQCRKN